MNKRTGYVVVLGMFFFCLFSSCFAASGSAWQNFDGNKHTAPVGWGSYSYDRHYGTHDWLADFALEAILKNPVLTAKWFDTNMDFFWTPSRKRIFLYATYGPDSSNVWIRTRHNQIVRGQGDKNSHHITFDFQTREMTGSWAAEKADKYASAAIKAFEDGDCMTAAFFLGEMTHYIADMSNIFHVKKLNNVVWGTIHTNYEFRVVDRTLGRNKFLDETEFDPAKRTWFFDVDALIPIYRFTSPGILAIRMAYETYFGTPILGEWDYKWDYDFMMECIGEPGDPNGWHYSRFWPKDKSWKHWSSGSVPGDITMYNFIKRTEHLLNRAISYIASALDWVIDQVQAYTCKPNPYAELSAGEQFTDVFTDAAADLLFVGFFKAMTYIGSFAAVYAIPLSSKFLKY